MDRTFIFSRKGIEDKYDEDARRTFERLKAIAGRSFDFVAVEGDPIPEPFRKASEENPSKLIPVGDIDFIRGYLKKADAADPDMRTIEIPSSLIPFAGRFYRKMSGREVLEGGYADVGKWFLKDATEAKKWTSALCLNDASGYIDPNRTYVVSGLVDVEAEYRCFALNDEILGVQAYAGNPLSFPSGEGIRTMIEAYRAEKRPKAYVLDVAVIRSDGGERKTVPMEVHPFAACGLYGFMDDRIGVMLDAGYSWYLKGDGLNPDRA